MMATLRLVRSLFAIAAAAALPALAGSYAVSPVTVRLTPQRAIAEVAIENKGEGTLRLEARTFAWSQPDGEDQLDATRDVIAFPPVFVLKPGERQVVRVAWRGAPTKSERAFRLRIDELPGEAQTANVAVMLRQVLPVFFQPAESGTVRLEGELEGALRVRLKNDGTTHLRSLATRWYDAKGAIVAERQEPFYLLAGAARSIALPPWPAQRHEARTLKLQTPQGEVEIPAR